MDWTAGAAALCLEVEQGASKSSLIKIFNFARRGILVIAIHVALQRRLLWVEPFTLARDMAREMRSNVNEQEMVDRRYRHKR